MASWICALISSDGSVKYQYNKRGDRHQGEIYLSYSSEFDWLKIIKKILINHQIGTSIFTRRQKTQVAEGNWGYVKLNKRFPKGKQFGINQYQVLRDNIEYHNLQDFIITRKYEELCKFTDNPKLDNKITQTSLK